MAVVTKALQVEKYLRGAIQSGRLNKGEPLPSERDLVTRFKVSRATLRDALNTLATEGLIVRKQGSGTYVNGEQKAPVAAILGRSELLSSPMGYFFNSMTDAMRERMDLNGFRTVLSITHGQTQEAIASSVQLLDDSFLNELVGVFDITFDSRALRNRIADLGIPVVAIEAEVPEGEHTVVLDYAAMTRLAVDTMNAHGYEDFALMHICDPGDDYHERIPKGFDKMQLAAVGNREERLIGVPRTFDLHQAYDIFVEWWARKDRPNAIFFFDDALCDVSTRAILELGIKVPEELAIITQANQGRKFHFPVPLTRVEFDPVRAVDAAWDMLHKLIRQEPIDEPTVYIEPSLFEGQSLGRNTHTSSDAWSDSRESTAAILAG
jgi:GntR family transcriptional regulator, arabinose operon transcriptional repressor